MGSRQQSNGGANISKLHQIVRLRQMLRKWRMTANWANLGNALSPRKSRSKAAETSGPEQRDQNTRCTQDNTCEQMGSIEVLVGRDRRRFRVKEELLQHSVVQAVLQRSSKHSDNHACTHHDHPYIYDDQNLIRDQDPLIIPCKSTLLFEHLLWMVEQNHLHVRSSSDLSELLDFYNIGPSPTTNLHNYAANCNSSYPCFPIVS